MLLFLLFSMLVQTRVDPQQVRWGALTPGQVDGRFFRDCTAPPVPPIQNGTWLRVSQIRNYGWKISPDGTQATLYGPAGAPLRMSSVTGRSTGSIEFRFLGPTPNFNFLAIPLDEIAIVGGRGHVKITAGTYTHPPMLTFTLMDGKFSAGPVIDYPDTCAASGL